MAKEKRKRAEKKLRLVQETKASNNLPLQAIGESTVESDASTTEAIEAAEAALEAKSREVEALLQEKQEWCAEPHSCTQCPGCALWSHSFGVFASQGT